MPTPEPEDEIPSASPAAAAGPAVRRLARELGVELSRVRGSGPGGRILREDVIAAVRHRHRQRHNHGAANRARRIATTGDRSAAKRCPKIRKTIAANMVRSAFTIPHVTNFDDADITELERIRKGSAGRLRRPERQADHDALRDEGGRPQRSSCIRCSTPRSTWTTTRSSTRTT